MTQTDELLFWTHEQKCLKAVASLVKNWATPPNARRPRFTDLRVLVVNADLGF